MLDAIEHDRRQQALKLPSLPEILMKVREALDTPETPSAHIARLIQTDPSLSTKLLQLANSPLYAKDREIISIQEAVTRMGHKVVRNLVMTVLLEDVFKAISPLLNERVRRLWDHSLDVAVLSALLAGLTTKLDADKAMLAGLLHDIGIIPILHYAQAEPSLRAEHSNELEAVIQRLRAEYGPIVLRYWEMDEDICRAAADAEDWLREGGNEIDYSDIVILAQRHLMMDDQISADLPPFPDMPAFQKLADQELTPQMSLKVLNDARTEISQIRALLS